MVSTNVPFCSLASLLPQHHISSVDVKAHKREPRPMGDTDNTTVSSSMLGQPPSNLGDDESGSHEDEDNLGADLRVIWLKAGCGDFDLILQDGIDESKALLFGSKGIPTIALSSS